MDDIASRVIRGGAVPCVLGALVLLAWGRMLGGGLVSDDWVWLERARTGMVLEPGLFFRPGCWCSWRLQADGRPGIVHLVDLALHWACGWQLARLAGLLSRNMVAGFAAAAVFVTWPALHETVCWSSARCGPLAAACVLAAMTAVLSRRGRALALPLLVCALAGHESALALMWGLPLLALARGNRKDAFLWSGILVGLTLAYAAAVHATGAHARLSGGYSVPFNLRRTLAHLGGYVGLAMGREGTAAAWPVWPALGTVAAWGALRGRWVFLAVWVWASVTMIPFIRLGGPDQPRFLYVMALPVMVGIGCALELVRWRHLRVAAVAAALSLSLVNSPQAWAFCREWKAAGMRVMTVVSQAARAFPQDRPAIAVNTLEWEGRAHVLRNGLFPALRLVTGAPYRGVSIPGSQSIRTGGELVAWLGRNAPSFLEDSRVGAWLFTGDDMCRLRGWREPSASGMSLERLCE